MKTVVKSNSAKISHPLAKPLSITLPASAAVSGLLMTIKMPDRKVVTLLKAYSMKNKATTVPAIKFAKTGVYVLTVKIGTQKKTLTITVK